MIAEGLRMKIAVVFLILVGLAVVGLPFAIAGDASLTGRVQSFLSYAFTASGFLLALLTIFLSWSLSDDMVQRHVFLILTKPVPRWQFMLGKWLGIVLLDVAFLMFSGLVTYGMVHYIRWRYPPIEERFDKAELENEVLVARHAIKARVPDFEKPSDEEFERNLEEGLYANIPKFNAAEERTRLRNKNEARWRVVGPLEAREFEFEGVLCDRSPKREVQIRYKTEISSYPPDEIFRAIWRVGDARKGTPTYQVPVRHIIGRRHTIRVPADAIAADHTLHVEFFNENPFPQEPQYRNVIEFRKADEVELLFTVGTFEGNLIRLLILMTCKLMFLAAVSLMMTAVFSFPVACLSTFTIYVLAGARPFISEALDLSSDDTAAMFSSVKEFLVQSITYVMNALCWAIPNFSYFDGVETLVNGRNVGLVWVLQAVTDLVLLRTSLVLGMAMLLFQRREVAEVSL